MSKSPDAFRTISEVAEWLGIPAHVLRFWESKFTQIKPVKRAGGRRYYRPSDMMLLGGIKRLLHDEGQTIKQVQALLRDHGPTFVAERSASLEAAADPMPVVETEETIIDFPAPRPTVPDQMRMDLDTSHEDSLPELSVKPHLEPEPTGLPSQNGSAKAMSAVPDEPQAASKITEAVVDAAPENTPRIIEIEDIADDSLTVARAGILAQLANVTKLDRPAQQQAMGFAEQLRALSARSNNLPGN